MKKLLFLIFAVAAPCIVVLGTSCSMLGGTTVQTPSSIAASVCPPAQAALTVLSTPGTTLTAAQQASFAKVQGMVATLCTGATTLSMTSIESMLQTGMPLMLNLLQAVGVGANAPIIGDLVLGISVLEAIYANLPAPLTPTPVATKYRLATVPYVCYANGKLPACPPRD